MVVKLSHMLLIGMALAALTRAVGAEQGFTVFLEERVGLVPEQVGIPAEALPELTMRVNADSKGMALTFDCDFRNLNPPEGSAAPYRLELAIGGGDAKSPLLRISLPGLRGSDEVALQPVLVPAEAGGVPPAADSVGARQLVRQDGVCRVTVTIARDYLEKAGLDNGFPLQAVWRQLTGVGEDGLPEYAATGGLVLALPGQRAILRPRAPLPADVAAMLEMLGKAPDARCGQRCLQRLLWVGRKDDAVRGALVMALDHSDPLLRGAAAKVWMEWNSPDTPGLAELKAKAKAILDTQAN